MLNQAITELCSLPDSQIIDISSFYESEPAYYEDQDTFVNAVVLLRTGIAPKELLGYLHAIENSLGRVREIENGPRTCDLDILDYQLYVTDNDVLTLPHPRIFERDFVLKPLLELRPNHVLADDVRVAQAAKPESERYGKAERIGPLSCGKRQGLRLADGCRGAGSDIGLAGSGSGCRLGRWAVILRCWPLAHCGFPRPCDGFTPCRHIRGERCWDAVSRAII